MVNTLINNRNRFYGYLLRIKTVPQKVSNIILRDEDKVQDGNNQSGNMKREGRTREEMVEKEEEQSRQHFKTDRWKGLVASQST